LHLRFVVAIHPSIRSYIRTLQAERESAFIQMEQQQIQQLRAQGYSMDHIHQLQQTGQLLQMAQQGGMAPPAGMPQGQPAPGSGAPMGMTPL
jgi:hypothetical protein